MPAGDAPATGADFPEYPDNSWYEWAPVTVADVWKRYFKDADGYKSGEQDVRVVADTMVNANLVLGNAYQRTLGIAAKIFVFISGDGVKLLKAYKACEKVVREDELVLFIEDNTGDVLSGAVRLMLAGNNVAKDVLDAAAATGIAGNINANVNANILTAADVDKLFAALNSGQTIRSWLLTKFVQGALIVDRLFLSQQTEILKGISGFISDTLRIPEKIWNPAKAEEGSPAVEKAAKDALKIITDCIETMIGPVSPEMQGLNRAGAAKSKQLPDKDATTIAGITQSGAMAGAVHSAIEAAVLAGGELSFAFICGFWNSFVDLLTSIFDLAALFLEVMIGSMDVLSDPYYYFSLLLEFQDNLLQYIMKIDWKEVLLQSVSFQLRLTKYALTELPKVLPALLQPAIIGYCSGYIGFLVLDFFIPVIDLTLIARFTRLAADGAEAFMDGVAYIAKRVLNLAEDAAPKLETLIKAMDATLATLKKGTKGIAEFFERLWEAVVKWIDEVLGIKPKPAEKDLLAEWNEMAGVSGRGRRLGQRLLKKDLEKIKAFLGKMGFELELHPAEGEYVVEGFFNLAREPITLAEGAQAMFVCTAEKGKVVLREGCTMNEFFHELMHAKHAKNLGLKKYIGLGGRGTMGQLIKEQLVFDRTVQYKELFTQKELENALTYINDTRKDFGKDQLTFDFDIQKIPIVRKEIYVEKIFKIK